MADDFYQMASPDIYALLKANARHNRREMTLAEAVMWDVLRDALPQFRFRRQHVIGDFIADFVCLAKHLVIEVDGEYHCTEEQQRQDELRTQILEKRGFRVLKFNNQEVLNNVQSVIETIEGFLKKEDSRFSE